MSFLQPKAGHRAEHGGPTAALFLMQTGLPLVLLATWATLPAHVQPSTDQHPQLHFLCSLPAIPPQSCSAVWGGGGTWPRRTSSHWLQPGSALIAPWGLAELALGAERSRAALQSHEQQRGGSSGHQDAAGLQGSVPRPAAHQGRAGLLPQPLPDLEGGERCEKARRVGLVIGWVSLVSQDPQGWKRSIGSPSATASHQLPPILIPRCKTQMSLERPQAWRLLASLCSPLHGPASCGAVIFPTIRPKSLAKQKQNQNQPRFLLNFQIVERELEKSVVFEDDLRFEIFFKRRLMNLMYDLEEEGLDWDLM